ncbi:putative protein phosphatase 2C 24 [Forsythia ovata]|uniref:protein-serine/threonine phosphatase n=1 Tax=Forsythia ovata TaxID=205694 RepID=A0ABD1WDJ2_9LAMI
MTPDCGKTSVFHAKKGLMLAGEMESQQPVSTTLQAKFDSGQCSSESSSSAPKEETGAAGEGLKFGQISMMGRRRVMEDAVSVAPPWKVGGAYAFFAVYDGHGGCMAAEICGERLHKCVDENVEKEKKSPEDKSFNWEKVMVECFRSMDEVVAKDKGGDGNVVEEGGSSVSETTVGSTALVVLVGADEVVVANCGDSRAVLCSGGVPVPLSSDHKPDRPDEKERIEAARGNIINWNWLASRRSNHYLKPYVIPDPEVTIYKRKESDDFLILATDGLWDVVSNEIACEIVRRCLNDQITRPLPGESGADEAASMLAELAIAKGSKDNISIIVVQLD